MDFIYLLIPALNLLGLGIVLKRLVQPAESED